MTRGTVRVRLRRREAEVSGPMLEAVLGRAGVERVMRYPYRGRRGVLLIHPDDVAVISSAAETLGLRVEVLDRDGRPVAVGGLLGVAW